METDFLNSLTEPLATLINRNSGSYIFRQGEQCSAMYYLKSGQVQLRRYTTTGDQQIVHHAISGTFFAEASIFSDTYHCDAVCQSDSGLLRLDKKGILDALERDARFSISFSKMLARQVQAYRQQVEIMAIKSSQERVWQALNAGFLKGSIMDFSATIGLSHESVYRSLAHLVRAGKLKKTQRGNYEITGPTP
ncbi:Crp/Fnr family transcriptional regulator [Cohaesibacter intestini]|uniref:Crp/Fnr family transcriptional regulator n=1 Tax=Cohaesibacter intestini TaxID=2211145 RepID=UPI000DE9B8B5|nr:Crp/Fnr family transcriptional regulator [Cohaesibacter intestini]